MKTKNPVILIIRDGWGYRKNCKDNAICEANPKATESLMNKYPHVLLNASGEASGLPEGYQGNSEVGHMTIGSGRIIFQSMIRISKSIKDKSFFSIPEFISAIENCKKHGTSLHLIGLLQTEGVHAHINHLFALLDLCKKRNFKNVYIHVITDGRDSPVTNSIKMLNLLYKKIKSPDFGKIASISGRYYTMDRNKRWERTKKAYDCIVLGKTEGNIEGFDDAIKAVKQCHKNKETDEFIIPIKAKWYKGFSKNDSVIFYNFRTDRTRQLTKAIIEKKFEGWNRGERKKSPINVFFVAMTQYYSPMNAKVAFKDLKLKNLLGEVISKAGMKQLRIAETEKYAHVTFFFNGQNEKPFKGEDRILINSPRVATYDLKPEMSAYLITENLLRNIKSKKYDLIVVNFANSDMVGHTGISNAIIKSVKVVDECIGKIADEGLKNNYTLLISADHGNAEDQTKKWRTSHTINPVPLILISNNKTFSKAKLKKGKGLKDIAPTILKIMGINKPKEMTGENLIK